MSDEKEITGDIKHPPSNSKPNSGQEFQNQEKVDELSTIHQIQENKQNLDLKGDLKNSKTSQNDGMEIFFHFNYL